MLHTNNTLQLGSNNPDAMRRTLELTPISPDDEAEVEAFVRSHGAHGPGHRRAFAALDQQTGLQPCAQVARQGGDIVGVAPAVVMEGRVLRILRAASVGGGSLVAAAPLVAPSLTDAAAHEVRAALVDSVARGARRAGALRLTWIVPPFEPSAGATVPARDAGARAQAAALSASAPGALLDAVPSALLDLTQAPDLLWRGVSATTRNLIRRAERAGLDASTLGGADASAALGAFAAQAPAAFGHRADASAAFDAARACLFAESVQPPIAHVTVVTDGREALSAVVTCESNGCGYYLLAFNTHAGLEANANRLGLWRAIESARSRGVQQFLLGSLDEGEGKAAAISRFKRQFGGAEVSAPRVTWRLRPRTERLHEVASRLVGTIRRSRR